MVARLHNVTPKLSPKNRITKQINNRKKTLNEIREIFTICFHHLLCFFFLSYPKF